MRRRPTAFGAAKRSGSELANLRSERARNRKRNTVQTLAMRISFNTELPYIAEAGIFIPFL